MVGGFNPGEHVLHPSYGPCAVLGVQADAVAGECLAIAPMRSQTAVVRIPLSKLQPAKLRSLTAAEAQAMASAPADQMQFKWKARLRWA